MNKNAQDRLGDIRCFRGDITDCEVDAIVNAANSSLMGGGGVDGAIHRAAGPALVHACRALQPPGCKTGEARITPAFELKAQSVIHTVGPVYRDGSVGESALLASCYRSCVKLAAQNGIQTMAFPAISCGIFGYPVGEAAEIALTSLAEALGENPDVSHISMVLFEEEVYRIFQETHKLLGAGS